MVFCAAALIAASGVLVYLLSSLLITGLAALFMPLILALAVMAFLLAMTMIGRRGLSFTLAWLCFADGLLAATFAALIVRHLAQGESLFSSPFLVVLLPLMVAVALGGTGFMILQAGGYLQKKETPKDFALRFPEAAAWFDAWHFADKSALKDLEARRIVLARARWLLAAAFVIGAYIATGAGLLVVFLIASCFAAAAYMFTVRSWERAVRTPFYEAAGPALGLAIAERRDNFPLALFRDFHVIPQYLGAETYQFMTGKRGDASYTLCRATLRGRTWKTPNMTVFDGFLVECVYDRAFKSTAKILSARGNGLFAARDRAWMQEQKINLVYSAFAGEFRVYANDQVEARALLTPDVLEKFAALARALPEALSVQALIHGSRLLLAFDMKRDPATASLSTPLGDQGRIRDLAAALVLVQQALDIMALDRAPGMFANEAAPQTAPAARAADTPGIILFPGPAQKAPAPAAQPAARKTMDPVLAKKIRLQVEKAIAPLDNMPFYLHAQSQPRFEPEGAYLEVRAGPDDRDQNFELFFYEGAIEKVRLFVNAFDRPLDIVPSGSKPPLRFPDDAALVNNMYRAVLDDERREFVPFVPTGSPFRLPFDAGRVKLDIPGKTLTLFIDDPHPQGAGGGQAYGVVIPFEIDLEDNGRLCFMLPSAEAGQVGARTAEGAVLPLARAAVDDTLQRIIWQRPVTIAIDGRNYKNPRV